MKLLALSPFKNAKPGDVLDMVAASDANLIVLPGHASNTPLPTQLQRVLRSGSAVFVEGPGSRKMGGPFLVTSDTMTRMPGQFFGNRPSASDVDALSSAIPQRTFTIAGRKVTFILCGEITAFNPDGTLKHGHHVSLTTLVNPAHSPMGRWHVLDSKFKSLSRVSVAVHVANNTNVQPERATTDVRIYRHGIHLPGRQFNKCAAWCTCEA